MHVSYPEQATLALLSKLADHPLELVQLCSITVIAWTLAAAGLFFWCRVSVEKADGRRREA